MNYFPAGTLVVLVNKENVVQTVGNIYGWGEEIHKDDPDYNPEYWKDVVMFTENTGYGMSGQEIYQLDEIPSGIESPYDRFLYTEEGGFVKNPNYKEPSPYPGVTENVLQQIKEDSFNELIAEISAMNVLEGESLNE